MLLLWKLWHNVMIGAVLSWKPRVFRLQLQVFSLCCVGINYCDVMPLHYRLYVFRTRKNIVCNGTHFWGTFPFLACWTLQLQSWRWCRFCCSLRFWQFVHHPSKIPLSDLKPFSAFEGVVYGWWSPIACVFSLNKWFYRVMGCNLTWWAQNWPKSHPPPPKKK